MKAKYINPFTDFGFKKIFGEEASKPLLLDFLGSILPEIQLIDLSFKDKEKLGKTPEDRKAIYDLYCETQAGEKIIIELQKAKQNYFKDRSIYYATFPIQQQAEKGEWNYKLKAVYCVGILDFVFDDGQESAPDVIQDIQLKNQNNKIFSKNLKFIFLEMPRFTKTEHELESRQDKWLYFIKHLEDFQAIPAIFKDQIFVQAFEKAELAKYSPKEQHEYEESLKTYRDLKGVIDTAFDDGKLEGKLEGKIEGKIEERLEIARKAKLMGMPIADIAKLTGLSEAKIEAL
jgi:predicted transposase/invertase (TIGR01784 family)